MADGAGSSRKRHGIGPYNYSMGTILHFHRRSRFAADETPRDAEPIGSAASLTGFWRRLLRNACVVFSAAAGCFLAAAGCFFVGAGCSCRSESPSPTPVSTAVSVPSSATVPYVPSDQRLSEVVTTRTWSVEADEAQHRQYGWPASFQMPIEYHIDVPEPPPEIVGPSPPIEVPTN